MCSLSTIKDSEGHKMILNIRCDNDMLERYGVFSFFDLITDIYFITCVIVRRNSSMQKCLTFSVQVSPCPSFSGFIVFIVFQFFLISTYLLRESN